MISEVQRLMWRYLHEIDDKTIRGLKHLAIDHPSYDTEFFQYLARNFTQLETVRLMSSRLRIETTRSQVIVDEHNISDLCATFRSQIWSLEDAFWGLRPGSMMPTFLLYDSHQMLNDFGMREATQLERKGDYDSHKYKVITRD